MTALLDSSGWQVLRHGGRKGDDWRLVFYGTEDLARERFSVEVDHLRPSEDARAGVKLVSPDGQLVRQRWACPSLRSLG